MVQEEKLWYDYIIMVRSGNADSCYGYKRLKRTSVATIASRFVDSKHYNSFPFTLIGVDLLC